MFIIKDKSILDELKDPKRFGTLIEKPSKDNLDEGEKGGRVFLCGDMTTQTFLENQVDFDMAVIDFKTKRESMTGVRDILQKNSRDNSPKCCPKCGREEEDEDDDDFDRSLSNQYKDRMSGSSILSIKNPPGVISNQLMETIRNHWTYDHMTFLVVDGEEDLAVLVAILLLPPGTRIYYGQPPALGFGSGIVRCEVTYPLLIEACRIFSKMVYEKEG